MHFIDQAFDHYARYGNALITNSAGNRVNCGANMYVESAGLGWNVLAVGASDNKENSAWSDDEMWGDSCWVNPSGTDRDKPEVAAPGVNIRAIQLNRNLATLTGTSAAAPQVAGLAALLINRSSQLSSWPESLRAILMASAINNVDGPSGIPTGQDQKDGAGVIDAALADAIAKTHWTSATSPCTGPCWWGVSINNTDFPVGGNLYRYFNVSKGERVRASISWWSNVNCPDSANCLIDRLDTDLNLAILDPNGQPVAYSASWGNNYELVDFIAEMSGTYKIDVIKARADDYSNYLGIAWVKDSTYLPDLRNKDGMASTIYVRNDGAETRSVETHYFDQNGNPIISGQGYDHDVCVLLPSQWCWMPLNDDQQRFPSGTIGSATVSGGEDVSVAIIQVKSTPQVYAAYTAVSQPSGEIHVPLLHKNNSGWHSDLFIRNTGTAAANVTVNFKANTGTSCPRSYSIPANGLKVVSLDSVSCVGGTFIGSAWITASQPVAVASNQYHLNASAQTDALMELEQVGNGAATVYAPLIQNYNYNWLSGIHLQNASASTNNLYVDFWDGDPGPCDPDQYTNVAAHYTVIDSNPPGTQDCSTVLSAILRGGSLPVAATINQRKTGTLMWTDYPAVTTPGQAVSLPLWYNQWGNWSSSANVFNFNSQSVEVTLTLYNSDGSSPWAPVTHTVPPHQVYAFYGLPAGQSMLGSATITATRPVAVVANHLLNGASGDGIMSQIGVHR